MPEDQDSLNTYEQKQIRQYVRDRLAGITIDTTSLPKWLADLENIRVAAKKEKNKERKPRRIYWRRNPAAAWYKAKKSGKFKIVMPRAGDILNTVGCDRGWEQYIPEDLYAELDREESIAIWYILKLKEE